MKGFVNHGAVGIDSATYKIPKKSSLAYITGMSPTKTMP